MYSTGSYQAHDLTGIILSGNNLSGWNLAGQNLNDATLAGATLTGADLTAPSARDILWWFKLNAPATFRDCQLSGIRFEGNRFYRQ